jgi:hypothetical protein
MERICSDFSQEDVLKPLVRALRDEKLEPQQKIQVLDLLCEIIEDPTAGERLAILNKDHNKDRDRDQPTVWKALFTVLSATVVNASVCMKGSVQLVGLLLDSKAGGSSLASDGSLSGLVKILVRESSNSAGDIQLFACTALAKICVAHMQSTASNGVPLLPVSLLDLLSVDDLITVSTVPHDEVSSSALKVLAVKLENGAMPSYHSFSFPYASGRLTKSRKGVAGLLSMGQGDNRRYFVLHDGFLYKWRQKSPGLSEADEKWCMQGCRISLMDTTHTNRNEKKNSLTRNKDTNSGYLQITPPQSSQDSIIMSDPDAGSIVDWYEALLECAGTSIISGSGGGTAHEQSTSAESTASTNSHPEAGEESVKKQYNMHGVRFIGWGTFHVESLLPILLNLVRNHVDDPGLVKTIEQCSRLLCTLSSSAGREHRQQLLGEGHKDKGKHSTLGFSIIDASITMLDSLNTTIHSNAAKTLANLIDVPPAPHTANKGDDKNGGAGKQQDASFPPQKGAYARQYFVAEQLMSFSGTSKRLLKLLWSEDPAVVHASLKMIKSMVCLPSSKSSRYLARHDDLLASLSDSTEGIAAIVNAKKISISTADLGFLCMAQCKLLRSMESHERSAIDNDALALMLDYLFFLLSVFGGSAIDGKPLMNDTFFEKQMGACKKENRRRHIVYDRARTEVVQTLCHFFADPEKIGYMNCLTMSQISLLLATEINGIVVQSLEIMSGNCTATLQVSRTAQLDRQDPDSGGALPRPSSSGMIDVRQSEIDLDMSRSSEADSTKALLPRNSSVANALEDVVEKKKRRRRTTLGHEHVLERRAEIAQGQLDCIVRTLKHSLAGHFGDGEDSLKMLTFGVKALEGLARSSHYKHAIVTAGGIEALMEIVARQDHSSKPKDVSSLISKVGDAVSFTNSLKPMTLDSTLRSKAAMALRCLVVGCPQFFDRVCACQGGRGAAHLLDILSKDHPFLSKAISDVINALATSPEHRKQLAEDPETLPAILKYLDTEDRHLQNGVCLILSTLCDDRSLRQKLVSDFRIIQRVVVLLADDSDLGKDICAYSSVVLSKLMKCDKVRPAAWFAAACCLLFACRLFTGALLPLLLIAVCLLLFPFRRRSKSLNVSSQHQVRSGTF